MFMFIYVYFLLKTQSSNSIKAPFNPSLMISNNNNNNNKQFDGSACYPYQPQQPPYQPQQPSYHNCAAHFQHLKPKEKESNPNYCYDDYHNYNHSNSKKPRPMWILYCHSVEPNIYGNECRTYQIPLYNPGYVDVEYNSAEGRMMRSLKHGNAIYFGSTDSQNGKPASSQNFILKTAGYHSFVSQDFLSEEVMLFIM